MSIQTAIQNAQQKVANAYTAVSEKGGTLPATQNLSNLPAAIGSISGGDDGIPREVDSQGNYGYPKNSFQFNLPSNATNITEYALLRSFSQCVNLTSVDFSSILTISGYYAMEYAFQGCMHLQSVDLSSLTTISGVSALSNAFKNCISLVSVDLSNLTNITGSSGMYQAFNGCTSLTSVSLPSLTSVSGDRAMGYVFSGCTSLTSVDLSKLANVTGANAMAGIFAGTSLQALSFPSLTSNSFGSYTNQFNNMLQGVTGCTVHFPSNLQSVIGSWTDVVAGFGGTNTVVLFDLPKTEGHNTPV